MPAGATLGERGVNHFTHAYFPKDRFTRFELRGSRVYGEHGDVFVALLGARPLAYRAGSTDDLIQDGRETAWVCEISTVVRDHDFDAFVHRIEANALTFRDGRLAYETAARRLELTYAADFRVNGVAQDTSYARHDSPYARTARQAPTMLIEYGGRRLFLDFDHLIRREN